MTNETTGGAPMPHYDSRATSTAVASPVQGAALPDAADVLRSASLNTPVVQGAASASGAKGAAVKPWQERQAEHYAANKSYRPKYIFIHEEIAELRAALAEHAQAQPSEKLFKAIVMLGGLLKQGFISDEVFIEKVQAHLATPAPEQEAAQVVAKAAHMQIKEGQCVKFWYEGALPDGFYALAAESSVMRRFGAPAGQHDAGAAAICEACGCASAKPGAIQLCEPCRAEFKAWCARDAAANTNKGGE